MSRMSIQIWKFLKRFYLQLRKRLLLLSFLTAFLIIFVPSLSFPLSEEEEINISVYKNNSPSVVNITTTTLIRDFFSVYPKQGAGSGSIISPDGYILTNYHVIEDATQINITMTNGDKYKAQLVGADPENDIAVIKIMSPGRKRFQAMKLGDSDKLSVGQKVYAIGNPFGLNSTLTTGIISALERPLTTEKGMVIENVIQTDAPINPGNSGGPLLNTTGKMIGINTAIFSPSAGGNIGIGFAIPINIASELIPDLIKFGKVRRPWIGIIGVPIWEELARALSLPVDRGILVSEVVKGSPAHRGGLKGGARPVEISRTIIFLGGDIIVEVEGIKVKYMQDIKKALKGKKDRDIVKMKIVRKGRLVDKNIRIRLRG